MLSGSRLGDDLGVQPGHCFGAPVSPKTALPVGDGGQSRLRMLGPDGGGRCTSGVKAAVSACTALHLAAPLVPHPGYGSVSSEVTFLPSAVGRGAHSWLWRLREAV